MAMTEWPMRLLNVSGLESPRAGRFLVALRSVNGKGTCTPAKRSKRTVGFFIGGTGPFTQSAFDGAQVFNVKRLNAANRCRAVGTDLPGNQIARGDVQGSAHILGYGGLALGGSFGNSNHCFLR